MFSYFKKSFARKKARRVTQEYSPIIDTINLGKYGNIEFANWSNPLVSNFTIQEQTVTFFNQFIKPGDFIKDFEARHGDAYDYREYDHLNVFTGTHPEAIQQAVKAQDWEFIYDPSKNNMNRKEKIMKFLEMLTGKQFFIYTNYKVLKG